MSGPPYTSCSHPHTQPCLCWDNFVLQRLVSALSPFQIIFRTQFCVFSVARAHTLPSSLWQAASCVTGYFSYSKIIGRKDCFLFLNIQYLKLLLALTGSSVESFEENIPCRAHVNIPVRQVSHYGMDTAGQQSLMSLYIQMIIMCLRKVCHIPFMIKTS